MHKDKGSMLLYEWNHVRLDDVFHVSDPCEISVHPDELSSMVCRYGSPNHDASSPEVGSFLDTAGAVAFTSPAINSNSTVVPLQQESRLVREHYGAPLNVGPSVMLPSPSQSRSYVICRQARSPHSSTCSNVGFSKTSQNGHVADSPRSREVVSGRLSSFETVS